jgi:hypothetical protein
MMEGQLAFPGMPEPPPVPVKPPSPEKLALDKPPAPVGVLRARAGRCRSCSAVIVFALVTKTMHGRKTTRPHPYDVEPDPDGTTHLVVEGRRIMAYPINKNNRGGRLTLHKSHFKTCPAAQEWQRGGPDEPES